MPQLYPERKIDLFYSNEIRLKSATINENYVLVQVLTHGGFIPPSFQQQYVFNLDDFAQWIIKRSRDLYLQCIDNIDEQLQ